MGVEITRRAEFDAGHRVPSHSGKCHNPHGHRYVLDLTVEGRVQEVRGASDDGMVTDFSVLKDVMHKEIVEPWDHAFLLYSDDRPGIEALQLWERLDGRTLKIILLPFIPTAENLAREAFRRLDLALREMTTNDELVVTRVRIYETPSSWADTTR